MCELYIDIGGNVQNCVLWCGTVLKFHVGDLGLGRTSWWLVHNNEVAPRNHRKLPSYTGIYSLQPTALRNISIAIYSVIMTSKAWLTCVLCKGIARSAVRRSYVRIRVLRTGRAQLRSEAAVGSRCTWRTLRRVGYTWNAKNNNISRMRIILKFTHLTHIGALYKDSL